MHSLTKYLRTLSAGSVFTSLLFSTVLAADESVEVNVLNYIEAKTSLHFDRILDKGGSYNQWLHNQSLVTIEDKPQGSRRVNRDTLYSYAVVNISEGASFFLPNSEGRYLSVQVINQEHFSNRTYYETGEHALSVAEFDTPYVLLLARTLVDGADIADIERARRLQDRLAVNSQSDDPFVRPSFDLESLAVHDQKIGVVGRCLA